jgi:hypothetical protein
MIRYTEENETKNRPVSQGAHLEKVGESQEISMKNEKVLDSEAYIE